MGKLEFSKIVVFLMLIITVVWVTASYFLAWKCKDTNETVTVAIISTLIATILSYYVTKTTEKMSRNKYGLDKDGNKIREDDVCEYNQDTKSDN